MYKMGVTKMSYNKDTEKIMKREMMAERVARWSIPMGIVGFIVCLVTVVNIGNLTSIFYDLSGQEVLITLIVWFAFLVIVFLPCAFFTVIGLMTLADSVEMWIRAKLKQKREKENTNV